MPIKTILVPLTDTTAESGTLGTAFTLAKTFKAHVDVLHLCTDPTVSIFNMGDETYAPSLELVVKAEEKALQMAARIRKGFDAAAAKARLEIVDRPSAQTKATASYGEETGLNDYWIETRGRVSDLIVVRRPRNSADVTARTIAECAMMGTGRMVLLSPASAPDKVGSSVAIAWNGSVEASRAVTAAMPILKRARTVTAISVVEDGARDHNLDGLVKYLRRQGIRAKANAIKSRGGDTGKAVTAAAARAKADLLVMGAYTHSRVREMIFGGVTNHILGSCRIPVLLVH